MKKLPEIQRESGAEGQRQRLHQWLIEWQLEGLLAQSRLPKQGFVGPSQPWSAERTPMEVGQIRLLMPSDPESWLRPAYVALLREAPGGGYCCAPFGRFSEPALPGEWATGRGSALRVLCISNTGELGLARLQASWLVDRFSAEEARQVARVLAYLDFGDPLDPAILSGTGPPLIHPADPRRRYQDEEREWMAGLCRLADGGHAVWEGSFGYTDDDSLPLAAESRALYGAARRYAIQGSRVHLELTQGAGEADWEVRLVGTDGEPTEWLDGACLVTDDGFHSLALWHGRARVTARFAEGRFSLLTTGDRRISVQPV